MSNKRVAVVGGGAGGFFAAITIAESNPNTKVFIFEKSKEVLSKVRISGGGRCNVTHACFDPRELVKFYPRGEKELLGPFNKFCTGDTMDWFERRGVALKIEHDNRVFPESDSSETIIYCLEKEARKNGIEVFTQAAVTDIRRSDAGFIVEFTSGQKSVFDQVVVASGASGKVWELLRNLGHQIISPVPSLFTFNIKDGRLNNLQGISVTNAEIHLEDSDFFAEGPLLITHWGLSGPGILRLSAWGARWLSDKNYEATLIVNWLGGEDEQTVLDVIENWKKDHPKKQLSSSPFNEIPRRLWVKLLDHAHLSENSIWTDIPRNLLQRLAHQLTHAKFQIKGKSTNKEEFVTSGGVSLKEIDFKSFQSKVVPNLFFTGEVIDVDAITGGFNFQNAWTSGYLAGKFIADQK